MSITVKPNNGFENGEQNGPNIMDKMLEAAKVCSEYGIHFCDIPTNLKDTFINATTIKHQIEVDIRKHLDEVTELETQHNKCVTVLEAVVERTKMNADEPNDAPDEPKRDDRESIKKLESVFVTKILIPMFDPGFDTRSAELKKDISRLVTEFYQSITTDPEIDAAGYAILLKAGIETLIQVHES